MIDFRIILHFVSLIARQKQGILPCFHYSDKGFTGYKYLVSGKPGVGRPELDVVRSGLGVRSLKFNVLWTLKSEGERERWSDRSDLNS